MYGSGNLDMDENAVAAILREQMKNVPNKSRQKIEKINYGLCRFALWGDCNEDEISLLARLVTCTVQDLDAQQKKAYSERQKQDMPEKMHKENDCHWVTQDSCILKVEYARWFQALLPLWQQQKKEEPVLVAIDGRCGSGKTTLATLANRVLGCQVLHMDDFYLPLGKREKNWAEIPAGNIDFERFTKQVLQPIQKKESVRYIPYCCQTGEYGAEKRLEATKLTLIEGSYCQHPVLIPAYGYKMFLNCKSDVQQVRLQEREGSYYNMFRTRWIPLEEKFFDVYNVEKQADVRLDTSEECVYPYNR